MVVAAWALGSKPQSTQKVHVVALVLVECLGTHELSNMIIPAFPSRHSSEVDGASPGPRSEE